MKRETDRLWLDPFAPAHLEALHAMNNDPAIMRYLSSKGETRAMKRRPKRARLPLKDRTV